MQCDVSRTILRRGRVVYTSLFPLSMTSTTLETLPPTCKAQVTVARTPATPLSMNFCKWYVSICTIHVNKWKRFELNNASDRKICRAMSRKSIKCRDAMSTTWLLNFWTLTLIHCETCCRPVDTRARPGRWSLMNGIGGNQIFERSRPSRHLNSAAEVEG